MSVELRFETISEKRLIGNRLRMTFAENRTYELWRGFMPRRKEIKNNLNADLISMQVYNKSFDFVNFNPDKPFEKWAAVEVSDFDHVSSEMETFILTGGLYAVFIHKGPASEGERTYRYIFGTWLPASEYSVDDRPHFEILGKKNKNEDPCSEEEVWTPIKPKE
jgi:AraC family transcriptional regulator